MKDNAPVRPVKPRITHGQQQRWQQDAAAFIDHGESVAVIQAWLQEQGCPPRMREDVIRKTRASVRSEHRVIGLRMFLLGVGATALGAICGYGAWSGVPVGDGERLYGGGFFKLALALLILGVPPLIYGGWKMLSGSTVAAPVER